MGVLDVAIVNVALPSIQRSLDLSLGSLQWVVVTYGLLFGGFLLLGGRLADLIGRRWVFLGGNTLFALSSLAAGLASSLGVLVVARGLQGIGAALTAPAALSILTTTFSEGPDRNRALGIWGAVAGSGATAGVIAGGLLSGGPGWEWIFLINVPIGLGIVALSLWFIPDRPPPSNERHFDVAGAALVTGGILLFVYAINGTLADGGASPRTIVLLGASAILLLAFVAVEHRYPAPLLPIGMLRRRSLARGSVIAILVFGSFVPVTFLSTLYLQQVLGYSALRTGLAFLPMSLSTIVAARAVGNRLLQRLSSRTVLAGGMVLVSAGALMLSRASSDSALAGAIAAFAFTGFGLGVCVVAVQVAAFAGIAPHEAGLASGLLTTAQQIGGVVGVAVIATAAAARTDALVASQAALTSGEAIAGGLQMGFIGAAAVAAAGAAAAWGLLTGSH
jgi:EmrB/QacA subfamily drug resistance transporter